MKRIIGIFILMSCFNSAIGQNEISGYWYPLKRLIQIDKTRFDICTVENDYPITKIKFLNKNEISIFGYQAIDPYVASVEHDRRKEKWNVRDTVIQSLGYSDLLIGTKITFDIKDDTLKCRIINQKENISLMQVFVRKYDNIYFKDSEDEDLGYLLMKGKFVIGNSTDTLEWLKSGQILEKNKMTNKFWNFLSYKFKIYGQECQLDFSLQNIIELTNSKKEKQSYLLKRNGDSWNFYKIKRMYDLTTVAESEFSFSLFRINL